MKAPAPQLRRVHEKPHISVNNRSCCEDMPVFQRLRRHVFVAAPLQTVPRHLNQHVAHRVDRQQLSLDVKVWKRNRLQRQVVQLEGRNRSLDLNAHDRCLFPLHQPTAIDGSLKRQRLQLHQVSKRKKLRTA